MTLKAELIEISRSEVDLGQIARFCHAPIGEELDLHSYEYFPLDDSEISVEAKEQIDRFTRLAVNCFKRGHMRVFEFTTLLFRVRCPIYVARQLVRHRNGTFMEKSLRYLEAPDVMTVEPNYRAAYRDALDKYKALIQAGVRKEQARAVLPLCTPTEFLWQISLRSLFNVFDQRLDACAQEETRALVQQMYDEAHEYYPHLLDAWKESR